MKYEFQVRMQQRHLKTIVVAPASRPTICFARGFLSRNHAHSRGRLPIVSAPAPVLPVFSRSSAQRRGGEGHKPRPIADCRPR